jgi:hypothetical protein
MPHLVFSGTTCQTTKAVSDVAELIAEVRVPVVEKKRFVTPVRLRAAWVLPVAFLGVIASPVARTQTKTDALSIGFKNPPPAARPRVWWHWMNGNITREGVRLDLEWMQRAGIGGFHTFDANLATPVVVDKRLGYMSPEWKDVFRYATDLAGQMHFEEAIASSPGWSETGGPWVAPAEAMKKYVWSELKVTGGMPFHGRLPHPPSVAGEFQGRPVVPSMMGGAFKVPEFYADAVVLAYKEPDSEHGLKPTLTSSSPIDFSLLSDGDLNSYTSLALPKEDGEKAWIQYAYPTAETLRSITIVAIKKTLLDSLAPQEGDSGIALESSTDGVTYRVVVKVPKGGAVEHTLSFAPETAKYFRVTFLSLKPPPPPAGSSFLGTAKRPTEIPIAELTLNAGARVYRFEEKAAFTPVPELYSSPTPDFAPNDTIRKADVIDLTGKMQPDGSLDWMPPAGNWTIMRLGYSLTGTTNHPATKEATGLEVDKLNGKFVRHYMDQYLDTYQQTVGSAKMGRSGIGYVVTDSWEAGTQNWTDDMIAEFTKRRGYDPRPWLPVLAGRVVESGPASDHFLWDFRKTIQDLVADEHYGQVEASLKARGMGHYGESQEDGRAFIADGMEVKKLDEVPMGAMWVHNPGENAPLPNYDADDRESSSVAHIYGQNLAAAESMTTCDGNSAWAWSPASLKPTVDEEFLNGINRIAIHESAHQALVGKVPGISLGPCGQWFNRNETWAEQARPWIDYISRSSWMLQQGKNVADIAYFYGEDSNLTSIFHTSYPNVPEGYNFDYVNADALIHALFVEAGRIRTPGGVTYRVLYLDKFSRHMSLPVLRALHTLVAHGAIVAGDKPEGTPSLADDPMEFKRLSDDLFASGTGVISFGKGKVFAGQNAADALTKLHVEPDFALTTKDQPIRFTHRKLSDGDIYFVDNRSNNAVDTDASFRVAGKIAELWHAETGQALDASYTTSAGRTTVPLHLEPWGTAFVVFRKRTSRTHYDVPNQIETKLRTLDNGWDVSFQAARGAPATAHFDTLISWADSADMGIKYFSGAGSYTTSIEAAPEWFAKNLKIWIDLGDVRNLAVVTVNGKELGTVWHAPYRIDVTSALKPGSNVLCVKVINPWVNRLIGDAQPDVKDKFTFTTWKSYTAKSPLVPSGLLGPVTILKVATQ